jgi:hypothetical protein
MTTAPTVNSAYPASVEDLLPRARELADALGEVPSRNRLKKELRVGAPKATALRDALTRAEFAPPARPAEPMPETTETAPETTKTDPPAPETTETGNDPIGPPPTPPVPAPAEATAPADTSPLEGTPADPGANITTATSVPSPVPPAAPVKARPVRSWPVLLLALPAFVAIWGGWVGLGEMAGFGEINLLPGIVPDGGWATINSAITLPIGVETYAAYALRAWLSGTRVPPRARRFAKYSAIGSLALGFLGQAAYHVMASAGLTVAPWWITTLVSGLSVAVLGMGAALAHLLTSNEDTDR